MARWLVVLFSLTWALAGCGGKGASERSSSADTGQAGGPAKPAKLLPDELGGRKLHKEAFTGRVWLKARPDSYFTPEISADISEFLDRLARSPSDLCVAWALASDGPQVIAYRVAGAQAGALVKAYVEAVRAKIHITKRVLSGKDVTVTSLEVSATRGYIYGSHDVVYVTATNHESPQRLKELLSKLS